DGIPEKHAVHHTHSCTDRRYRTQTVKLAHSRLKRVSTTRFSRLRPAECVYGSSSLSSNSIARSSADLEEAGNPRKVPGPIEAWPDAFDTQLSLLARIPTARPVVPAGGMRGRGPPRLARRSSSRTRPRWSAAADSRAGTQPAAASRKPATFRSGEQ